MKKLYETPEMEVFNFETTDEVMDANTCPSNKSCDLDCPVEGQCSLEHMGCILDTPSCSSECSSDGFCSMDINISLP